MQLHAKNLAQRKAAKDARAVSTSGHYKRREDAEVRWLLLQKLPTLKMTAIGFLTSAHSRCQHSTRLEVARRTDGTGLRTGVPHANVILR